MKNHVSCCSFTTAWSSVHVHLGLLHPVAVPLHRWQFFRRVREHRGFFVVGKLAFVVPEFFILNPLLTSTSAHRAFHAPSLVLAEAIIKKAPADSVCLLRAFVKKQIIFCGPQNLILINKFWNPVNIREILGAGGRSSSSWSCTLWALADITLR